MNTISKFFHSIHQLAVANIEMQVRDLLKSGNEKKAVSVLLTAITFRLIREQDGIGIQTRTGLKL